MDTMLDVAPAELDAQVDMLINATPAVSEFEPDDMLMASLVTDMAQKIYGNRVIAARYGLTMAQLYNFVSIPAIRQRIKARRAAWESDGNVVERNRQLYGVLMLDAAPVFNKLIHGRESKPGDRLDALKVLTKLAGLESTPRQAVGDVTAGTGSQFSVTFNFSGGVVEKVSTVATPQTIEGSVE